MKFPNREEEIYAWSNRMFSGFQKHSADFPRIIIGRWRYRAARRERVSALSRLRLATKDKDEKLKQLKRVMKDCLRKSQVDAKGDPKKLNLIGCRARSEPSPIIPPNQPANLTPVTEGAGTVALSWDKPSNGSTGGYVRNYLIQRRDKESGEFGPWSLLDTVYHEIAELSGQPQQTQMEYRVKASNAAGESLPSNVATVVL